MKPHYQIPIVACDEPLVPIPNCFDFPQPHAYQALGAPYGDRSPYWLRREVCDRLCQAQAFLQTEHPQWRLSVFDAYRPIAVQQFMVDYSLQQLLQERGLEGDRLSEAQHQHLLTEVYQFWAPPSPDPATPPPHSTGGAVDLTIVDERGQAIEMGSPIDEMSPRSHPSYFEHRDLAIHAHRQILRHCMHKAGFYQHPNEWWHFSWGDQLWAWQDRQIAPHREAIARYGSV